MEVIREIIRGYGVDEDTVRVGMGKRKIVDLTYV